MTNKFHHFPFPITTPRLLLRPPCIADSSIVNAGIKESFHQLNKWMPWAQQPQSLEDTELFVRQSVANWIVQKNEEPWLPIFIFDRTTQEFIGATGYHHLQWDVPCLEMGYWIRASKSGNGLMTEAVNALTRYAFEELRVRRVAITCDAQNIPSQKIALRLGFRHEATLTQNRVMVDGTISDTFIFVRHSVTDLPVLKATW